MFIVWRHDTHEPEDGFDCELDSDVGHTNYGFLARGQLS